MVTVTRICLWGLVLSFAFGLNSPVLAVSGRPQDERQYQNAPGKRGDAVKEPGSRVEARETVGPEGARDTATAPPSGDEPASAHPLPGARDNQQRPAPVDLPPVEEAAPSQGR